MFCLNFNSPCLVFSGETALILWYNPVIWDSNGNILMSDKISWKQLDLLNKLGCHAAKSRFQNFNFSLHLNAYFYNMQYIADSLF